MTYTYRVEVSGLGEQEREEVEEYLNANGFGFTTVVER